MNATVATIDPADRFYHLLPAIERAIKRALYACQPADQEDAIQVGLMEVWRKLQDPTAASNTDSWYIFRAVGYARDYASRLVWRYRRRNTPIATLSTTSSTRDSIGDDVELPQDMCLDLASTDDMAQIEDAVYLSEIAARLTNDLQREIALRLATGERKTEIAAAMGIGYKSVIYQCNEIASALTF